MSNIESYIHLQSLTTEAGDPTPEAYAEARRTWLCMGCVSPKPGVHRVGIKIENRRLRGPLSGVNGCTVPLARLSFLMRFGEARVGRDLYLGDVFGPDGSRWDDWVTFRGRRGLIVRGTKHAGNRVCSDCGRNCYFAMHPRYLYPQPPTDVEVFQSDLCGLIVPPGVAAEAGITGRVRRFRGTEVIEWRDEELGVTPRRVLVERLPVLAEPKDGLPPLSFRPEE